MTRFVLLGAILLTAGAWPAGAWPAVPQDLAPASSYEATYGELMDLTPKAGRVADVNGLVLRRDIGVFTLESGRLYTLSPVGGRVVALYFQGRGRFAFAPPSRIEQDRLQRFLKTRALDLPVTDMVLLFADSTMAELERKVAFTPGDPPGAIRSRVKKALDYLADDDSKTFNAHVIAPFLNGDTTDLFYAHLERSGGGDPVMFLLDPSEFESVQLISRWSHAGWGRYPETVCQFPRNGALRPATGFGEETRRVDVRRYTMETTLTQTGLGGDLSFVLAGQLEIAADTDIGPWVAYNLNEALRVDSARWSTGEPATVFKGKDSPLLWVRFDRRLKAGETRTLRLAYHGDFIDRYGDFFFPKSFADWYPLSLDWRGRAVFDLTFHYPSQYLLASVGDRVDSSLAGRVRTTRWVTPAPARLASFNLGLFENHEIQEDSAPPVNVLISETAHRNFERTWETAASKAPLQRNVRQVVGDDLVKSFRFYRRVYGEPPVKRFYATEIPYYHGEAYPGLVHLSFVTFVQTDWDGEDEIFRAHEVAHQWWGISVEPASYHDVWLSEGFSDFSGLWYLQTVSKDKDKYFSALRRWRSAIFLRKNEPSPVWLGYRTSSSKDDNGYNVLVYKKGAWVLHMLRILMLDLKTMSEDRFTATMQDCYRTYAGKHATTEDFRRVVEQHMGAPMGWFFDQWVYGSAIPSYRVTTQFMSEENGQYHMRLLIDQDNVPPEFQMYVPVTVELGKGMTARLRVKVRGPHTEVDLPPMPAKPKSIRFNDFEGVLADVKMSN